MLQYFSSSTRFAHFFVEVSGWWFQPFLEGFWLLHRISPSNADIFLQNISQCKCRLFLRGSWFLPHIRRNVLKKPFSLHRQFVNWESLCFKQWCLQCSEKSVTCMVIVASRTEHFSESLLSSTSTGFFFIAPLARSSTGLRELGSGAVRPRRWHQRNMANACPPTPFRAGYQMEHFNGPLMWNTFFKLFLHYKFRNSMKKLM